VPLQAISPQLGVILFADVRGSTALAEQLGPVAFAALLNRFYRTATDVLIRHGATIDKLIGDEVMAFFVPGFAGRQGFGKIVLRPFRIIIEPLLTCLARHSASSCERAVG
jgi:hypothetical protein